MRFEYDKEANALYIYLRGKIPEGGAERARRWKATKVSVLRATDEPESFTAFRSYPGLHAEYALRLHVPHDNLQGVDRFLEGPGDEFQVVLGDDQGRRKGDDVVEPGGRVAGLAHDQATFFAPGEHLCGQSLRRLPGPLVLDELDAQEETLVADLTDVGMVFEVGEHLAKLFAHLRRALGKPFLLHDLQVAQGQGARGGVAAEGIYVAEVIVLLCP